MGLSMKQNIEIKSGELIILDTAENYKIDLKERLVHFTVNAIKFLETSPCRKEYGVFRYQFSKAATSIGAIYEKKSGINTKGIPCKSSNKLEGITGNPFLV